MADVLSVAKVPTNKNGIIRGANLNAKRADKYVRYLLRHGFLVSQDKSGKTFYRTTKKGLAWLSDYEKLVFEYARIMQEKEEIERTVLGK